MKQKNAFTKKDLIVVLFCVGFLLANLAAIGEAGRKRAKAVVCLSNLMKWGQIFQAYTADNDGFFHSRSIGVYNNLWPYVYKSYYIDKMMRFCPTAANPTLYTGSFGTWNYNLGGYRPTPDLPMPGEREYNPFNEVNAYEDGYYTGSYGMNRYIEDMKGSDATNLRFFRHAGVKGAAQAPVLMDSMYLYFWPSHNAPPPQYEGQYAGGGGEMRLQCINRHVGFVNAVFLDFSARKVGLKELWMLQYTRIRPPGEVFDTCGPWTSCGGVQPSDWPEWMKDFQDY
jgi:hypothetical protein